MLFRPFYGVMYGCVIRIACVGCIYMRAYIIISTCVRAKDMGAFVSHFRHLYAVASLSLYCAIATFMSVFLLFASYFWMNFKANLLLLRWNFFILASNAYLCSIKWGRFCIVFSPVLYPKRGEFAIFCRCNSNLIEMQKQCNSGLKRQKRTRFSHKSIKN